MSKDFWQKPKQMKAKTRKKETLIHRHNQCFLRSDISHVCPPLGSVLLFLGQITSILFPLVQNSNWMSTWFPLLMGGGHHTIKIGDNDVWSHWPPISTLLSPSDPLLNNSQPIFDNLSPKMILFWQHFVKIFPFFSNKKCVEIWILFKQKIAQKFNSYLFWSSHSMTHFQRKISLVKTPSFKFLSKKPNPFKIECSPPL